MKRAGLVSASFIFSFVIVTYGSTCDQPTSPHGSVITHPTRREKYQNGQVILFGCKQGFYLDGMPIITCNGNKWTQTQFRCLGFCPEVGNILNGKVSHVTPQVGKAAIEFRCANNSFQLIGKTRLECIDGQWNGKLPYCQKLPSCVRLQSPANGTLHGNDNSHGAEANFTCFTGFDLFGASALTCNKGVWSSRVPTCKANCMKIMDLPNGHVFGTRFSHGQVVSFNCKYGYELVGDRSLRCINGRWNSSVPQCKVMPCAKPSIPSNSRIIYPRTDQVSYTNGATLYLACHEGHLLTGSPIMECNYTTWLKREFKCIAKSCGRPRIPLHGNMKSHVFTFRSKVYFECNPGFKLVGDKYRQCQANQTWSGRVPTCKPIDCGRLSTPHKVLIVSETGHTRLGGYVKYRCKEKGYELIGSETRVCQNDEQWSGVEPSCQIINCGNPDAAANVKQIRITNGFDYGSSVEFACEANYILEGSKIITCGETKEWSPSAPSCLAPCSDPGKPWNGIRIGDDFTHGKFIKFICDDDFEGVGKKTIQCLNGKWSHKIPQCKEISCGDPGTPTHGRQTNVVKNFAFRGTVEFQCDKDYTLHGKSSLSCQRNKTWDGDVPKCLAPCSDPGTPLHGETIGSAFEHDSVVNFQCLSNRVLDGASRMKCNNGQWDAQRPTCRDCDGPLKTSRGNIKCSIEGQRSYTEINLQKENVITAASIQLGQDKRNVLQIQIQALLSSKWVPIFKPFKPSFSEGVKTIKLPQPIIAQSLRVLFITRQGLSSCLTPTLYGCDAVRRDCIMPGSAVLFKEGGKYRKGRFGFVSRDGLEVVVGKRHKYLRKDDILILDEKPNVNQLTEGTTVVGTDSRWKIKRGNIKRSCSSTHCPIETNGVEWRSKLEDVRVFKGELCK